MNISKQFLVVFLSILIVTSLVVIGIVGGKKYFAQQEAKHQLYLDYLQKGDDFLRKGEFSKSINSYLESLKFAKKNEEYIVRRNIALAYAAETQSKYSTSVPKEAFDQIEKAIEQAPDDSESYRIKGYLLEVSFNFPEAIKFYKKAIEKDPNNAFAWGGLAHCYFYLNNVEEAKKSLLKAFEISPSDPLISLAMVNFILIPEKNYDKAYDLLNRVIINPNIPPRRRAEAYNLLGRIMLDKKEYEKAKDYFEAALSEDPNYSLSYALEAASLILGFLENKISSKEVTKVIELLNKGQEINPSDARIKYWYGVFMSLIGQNEAAKAMLNLALDTVDKDITLWGPEVKNTLKGRIYFNLASVYSKTLETEKAIESLKKAISYDPSLRETLKNPYVIEFHFKNIKKNKEFQNLIGNI